MKTILARLEQLENAPRNMIPKFRAVFEDEHSETIWGAEIIRYGKSNGVKRVLFDEHNQNGVDIAALYALLHDAVEVLPTVF